MASYLLPVVLLLLLTAGCSPKTMRLVKPAEYPALTDDLPISSLKKAVKQSLAYLAKLPADRTFNYGARTCSVAWLIESQKTFLGLLRTTQNLEEINQRVREEFDLFRVNHRGFLNLFSRKMLITGYYAPLLEGSLTPQAPFLYPVYGVPPDLAWQTNPETGGRTYGRLVNGKLTPYPSRAEIETRNLLAGLKLAYLADPVDAFILQVQGSGRIRLRDGSIRSILFGAKNGRQYRSIGKLLVDQGKFTLAEADMPRLRRYLAEHPDEVQRILHHNESFIFFRWGGKQPVVGSLAVPLTAGRSVAADQLLMPPGSLAFLKSDAPMLDRKGRLRQWLPMSRFVLIQDSGSAIKGTGRLDLFWGATDHARAAAGLMKQPGELFFLLKKQPGEQTKKAH